MTASMLSSLTRTVSRSTSRSSRFSRTSRSSNLSDSSCTTTSSISSTSTTPNFSKPFSSLNPPSCLSARTSFDTTISSSFSATFEPSLPSLQPSEYTYEYTPPFPPDSIQPAVALYIPPNSATSSSDWAPNHGIKKAETWFWTCPYPCGTANQSWNRSCVSCDKAITEERWKEVERNIRGEELGWGGLVRRGGRRVRRWVGH
ncbi:hypothetical protein FPQ18DRAFT_405304 [Pyronema domesticum]|nr:hypothetical protein FPQ18DRAFT_405304 [Pyronema domesticum]